MDVDTTTLTDHGARLHPATADSAARRVSPAGVRGGRLGSLAARAAEGLARGLVTCVFATGQSSALRLLRGHGARLQPCVGYLALIDFVATLAVGTVLGAITGGLMGLATETGVLRGTGVGGLTGALVSMEVVESYLDIWRCSGEPAIWSVVYVVGAPCSALASASSVSALRP